MVFDPFSEVWSFPGEVDVGDPGAFRRVDPDVLEDWATRAPERRRRRVAPDGR